MPLKATLRWHFTPHDFFEAPFSAEFGGADIRIEKCEIIAELDRDLYEGPTHIHESLTLYIQSLFEGIQLLSHRTFEISEGSVEKEREGGGLDYAMRVDSGDYVVVGDSIDAKVIGPQGEIKSDTRGARIESKRDFARLVAANRGTDATFDSMIDSYSSAVNDPDDELIHLYEIRDAATAHFGSEADAIRSLGISRAKWSTLGRLANNEPLYQGRHRGKANTALRNATHAELEEARSIAREIIVRYANQLP